jgi:hypothetical protein
MLLHTILYNLQFTPINVHLLFGNLFLNTKHELLVINGNTLYINICKNKLREFSATNHLQNYNRPTKDKN